MAHAYGELGVFGGRGHPALLNAICASLGVEAGGIDLLTFANDNLFVRILENVRGKDVFFVQTCAPPVNERLVEILVALDAFKRASAGRLTVVLPYYPYARTDKKDQPRVPITAKLVADLLVTAGADRVLTMDLHSEQIQGFIDVPSDQLLAEPVLARHFVEMGFGEDNAVAVSPDTGSAQRVRRFAKRLGCPFAVIDKRRLGNSGKSKVLHVIGDVEGRAAILVDDEIDTGGTMANAANALLDRGASRVFAAASHGIFSDPGPRTLQDSALEGIVTTDTFPPPEGFGKLTTLSVAPLFASAIRAIHEGASITDIFR